MLTLCVLLSPSWTMTFIFIERVFVCGLICIYTSYAEFGCFSVVKKINDSVEFKCTAKNNQIKHIFWNKSNSTFTETEGLNISCDMTTLYFSTIKREDEGIYSCYYFGQLIGKYCLSVEVPPEMSIYVDSNYQQGSLWAKRGDIINLGCVAVGAIPFVNITWSLKDIKYITFGPTQTTVLEGGGSFTTNSSVSYMITKRVNFIECVSVGQNTSSQTASIIISSYDMYLMIDGSSVDREITMFSTDMLNISCIFEVSAHYLINLKWISNSESHFKSKIISNCVQQECIHVTNFTIFHITKDVNLSCISFGDHLPENFLTSTTVQIYVVPSIHIMLNGKNLTSPLKATPNTIYNFQCVAFGSKPTVNLVWKVDATLQKEQKTFQRLNEFNNDTYDCIISFSLNVTNSRTNISCFIESPSLQELALNATLDILTDEQKQEQWKFAVGIFLLLFSLTPIFVGLKLFWSKFNGVIHTKGISFSGRVEASEVNTSSNNEIETELYSDTGLYFETTADCHEKYQHKKSNGKQNEDVICRKNVIIASFLPGNGFVRYSVGHYMTENGKEIVVCKSVKDDAQVKDVYHFLKMADESSLLRHHPNVVELLAISKEEMPFYTYHEHVAGGSVRDYLLKNYQSSRISKSFVQDNRFEKHQEKFGLELRTFGLDVASGMEFLQTNKFCHPGLMAKKVLMNLEGCCKLYDFWPLEVSLQHTKRLLVKKNPPTAWLAPELIFLDQYHIKSDVWSFGVFLWELYSFGEVPYKSLSNTEIENSVRNSTHLSLPCSCPGAIINIMLSCWSKNTEKRPTFKAMYDELQSIRHGSSKPTSSSSTNCKESDSANERRHAYFVLNPDEEDYKEAK